MKFNTDPSFIGIEGLKQVHDNQIEQFKKWESRNDWEKFHGSHYDWWVFPIDRPSAYGYRYVVYEGEIRELKRDIQFIEKYLNGVEMVSASWGWDVREKRTLSSLQDGQGWHQWPIRLFKAALSVRLFGYDDLYNSLCIYADELMKRGERMEYGGQDLRWVFQ